jgi:hypothetical protein
MEIASVVACTSGRVQVEHKREVPYYELSTLKVSAAARQLDLVSHYGINISLVLRSLDGTLTETGQTRDKWE